jgi:hypothetical protein
LGFGREVYFASTSSYFVVAGRSKLTSFEGALLALYSPECVEGEFSAVHIQKAA